MNGNIFKRVEQKYVLDKNDYEKILKIINEYFEKDNYYQSKIYNIYFDNDNNDLLISSIEKPIFKKKIRARSYGDGMIFFEIKEKYKGIVYKRRIKLTENEYNNYINNGVVPGHDLQIMKEIDYYIKYYKLHPYMFIAYDRLSYYCKDDINFRITFDTNLRSRTNNLSLIDNKDNVYYFDDDRYIMEIKCRDSLPYWFVNKLSENKIYPVSFSKVGNIYKKEMKKNVK